MAQPSANEQLMLELINRARHNPQAEADRFGIDLNEGLTPGTIPPAAKQPLSFNEILIDAATNHSEWMLNTDIFSHTGVGGSSAGDRMATAGYGSLGSFGWGENIAWSGSTGSINLTDAVFGQHQGLFESPGHRTNILAADFKEIGIAQEYGEFTHESIDYNSSMITQNFAYKLDNPFLTGVLYNDADGDSFYTVGEGVANAVITATSESDTFARNTFASGGYGLQLPASDVFTISIGGDGLADVATARISLDTTNEKLDFVVGTAGDDTFAIPEPQANYSIEINSAGSAFIASDDWHFVTIDIERVAFTDATVTLAATNNDPIAIPDTITTDEDTPVSIPNVLANDSDPDGDTLSIASIDTSVTLGTVSDRGDGHFDYDPNEQFEALNDGDTTTDQFTYTISDGNGGTASATVTVTLLGVNDTLPNQPPSANDDSASTTENTPVDIPVLQNDADPDGDPLQVSSVSDPNHGDISLGPDGIVTYTPDANYIGSDAFTYTIEDPAGATAQGSVTVITTSQAITIGVIGTAGADVDTFGSNNHAIANLGGGDDRYILSNLQTGDLTINDLQGQNSVALAAGMQVTLAEFLPDAMHLVLENGADIYLNGASGFSYEIGTHLGTGVSAQDDLSYEGIAAFFGATIPTEQVVVTGSNAGTIDGDGVLL